MNASQEYARYPRDAARNVDKKYSLEGHLLVAMPSAEGTRFEHAVIYLCVHNEDGALELIINKPVDSLHFGDLLDLIPFSTDDILPLHENSAKQPILFGGLVETGRGFVLHSSDYEASDSTINVTSDICLTSTMDILKSIMVGAGPQHLLMTLGYAGWGPGQLESEMHANGWLHCLADLNLIFSQDFDGKYDRSLKKIGVTPSMLSERVGHT
ncbi:MAG: YqgE/AlgH family protein [Parvularculales bacterium]